MKHSPYLIWNFIIGLTYLAVVSQAARASSLILAKSKQVPQNTTLSLDEIVPIPISLAEVAGLNETLATVATNTSKLTGVPQIDYLLDPNLPRELNGYNLTEYPFYVSIPEEIDFKCDGLHDGFYASVAHKCQVYHHCLFGTRYDFLCANYTAFDQKTFICHFASEVDCKNSPKYYKRNEALYKQATTTTLAPPTTTTSKPSGDGNGRRRRPFRRRKPQYDYYDDYDEYEDDFGDDERRNKRPRNQSKEADSSESEDSLPTAPNKSLYDRPRVAPKVRRPVPVNEREKYDYSGDARVISTKAPPLADSYHEEEEKTDKRKNKPRTQDSSIEEGKSKDRERYRDRNRGRDEDFDNEKEKGNGREGDRDRGRGRDEEDDPIEDDRQGTRSRDEDSRERSRPRDEDRDRPRNRRPVGKKRKRPENYDYYDEYEEVRRPKPRDRPRYEDEDDYDDRYYRKPVRSRNRDRDRDRERERDRYRTRDEEDRRSKPKNSEKPSRNRDYEDEEDDRYTETRGKDDSRRKGSARENGRNRDEDIEVPVSKKQQESSASSQRGTVEPTPKRNQEKPKKVEIPESSEKESSQDYDIPSSADKDKNADSNISKTRQSFIQRKYTTSTKPPKIQESLPDETPLPAPRPAYITTPQENSRKHSQAAARKPSGFRRPTTQKYSEEEEEVPKEEVNSKEQSSESLPTPSVNSQKKNSRPEIGNQNIKPTAGAPQPEKTTKDSSLKVPYEEVVDDDLAPRAPKLPFMSNKRRPFLPSRGGDPSLLRGLTPVGAKAFAPPRKEEEIRPQDLTTSPAPSSRERFSSRPVAVDPNKFPTGIEFRTKVQANVGVEQPRLTPSYQDVVSSQEEDYSGEVESEESRREDSHNYETQRKPIQSVKFTKQDASYNYLRKPVPSERPTVSLRPALKPTDFPQVTSSVGADVENSQEIKARKYSSRLPQAVENKPTLQNTQYFSEVSQSKQTGYQQFGPQTFFSENPKFQTTIPLNEPPRPRPTAQNLNFNQGTQIPSFYQPIVKPGQGQVQVVHFQKNSPIEYSSVPSRKPAVKFPQAENLEDTDEYDVSFNDALQPISTLHPRNAQSGLLSAQRTGTIQSARRRATSAATQTSGSQRFAESVLQPQFSIPSSAFRNFHSEFYSPFAK